MSSYQQQQQRGRRNAPTRSSTATYIKTKERDIHYKEMVKKGLSETMKRNTIGKWIRDDEKIKQFASECSISTEGKDIMTLRQLTIEKLLKDYDFYKYYDDENNQFWRSQKESGYELEEEDEPQTLWFNREPNYWFENRLKGIYNQLNQLARVADHPEDPNHLPMIDDIFPNKILFRHHGKKNEEEKKEKETVQLPLWI
jgi:hypothetical protein